jgi:hypothetical protein
MANMTSRLIDAYASQDEPWKKDHNLAMKCRDAEDLIVNGLALFRTVSAIDVRTQLQGRGASEEFVQDCWTEVRGLYQVWLDGSARWLTRIEMLSAQGYEIEGLAEFRATIEEVANILGNDEYEKEIRPLDELRGMLKPGNPRPGRYGV